MASNSTNGGIDEVDLFQLRTPYSQSHFTEDQLVSSTNPVEQFRAWFKAALDCDQITEPNAVSLSTSTKDGRPSSRMVLTKHYSESGFTFFTNYKSRKGRELAENPQAAMLFYWPPLHRQVRIEGTVVRLSEEQSTEYFLKRPRSSQVSATVSPQSSVISSRDELAAKHAELMAATSDEEGVSLSRPDYWGGFLLVPSRFEFWQGQSNRLHDRIVFSRENLEGQDSWTLSRLGP